MAKGITLGMTNGDARILKRLLERRFGVLPEWASERLVSARLCHIKCSAARSGVRVMAEHMRTTLFKKSY